MSRGDICVPAFSTTQMIMLLRPKEWAGHLLDASKAGWNVSAELTEVAMRLKGDIGRDHLPKLQAGDNQEEEDL